jgi:hypothetical protein
MGLLDLFKRKPKIVKEISGITWGYLIRDHGLDVDTLTNHIRCVDKPGLKDGSQVTLLRVFSTREVAKKGITITGWETFDEHPELVMFEGYLSAADGLVKLERKNGQKAD